MKNLSEMLKQAQQMQEKMSEMQAQLAEREIEGTAGGGLVRVILNGKGEMRGVHIDPTLLVPEESEIVEDLIVAAHGEARTRVDEYAAEEMKKLTGGLNLPPGMKLPF